MPSLKIIKKRISSVKNTQKITRAMKLVSAAKLRRATERAHSSRPYEKDLVGIVSTILNEVEWSSPLIEERALRKVALVVITSDRGLCGSLNTNVMKLALKRANELHEQAVMVQIIALGKKANDFFKRRGFLVTKSYADLMRSATPNHMASIAKTLRELFLNKTVDAVEVFYSRFQSALVQKSTQFTLLPFRAEKNAGSGHYLFEPKADELLNALVPMLIDFSLYRVVVESVASEHGARMTAMESATKNAKEMIERLTLERNRARQAAITKELMEIVGGAEALAAQG